MVSGTHQCLYQGWTLELLIKQGLSAGLGKTDVDNHIPAAFAFAKPVWTYRWILKGSGLLCDSFQLHFR